MGRRGRELTPLPEADARHHLEVAPARPHHVGFALVEELPADQREVRVGVRDDVTVFAPGATGVDRSTRRAAKRPALPRGSGPPSRAAGALCAVLKASIAVSTVRQSGLARTPPIGIPSVRIASPMARE